MKTLANKLNGLKLALLSTIIVACISTNVLAQYDTVKSLPPVVKLSGPRLGITYVGPGSVQDAIHEAERTEVISQFGWQFENRLFSLEDGTTGLIEYVLLVGGLEQNMFLPSATMLIGLRTGSGFEFGAGPNLSLAGAGFAISVGYTIKNEYMYFPINLAVVPSNTGVRFSLLFGFNARRSR